MSVFLGGGILAKDPIKRIITTILCFIVAAGLTQRSSAQEKQDWFQKMLSDVQTEMEKTSYLRYSSLGRWTVYFDGHITLDTSKGCLATRIKSDIVDSAISPQGTLVIAADEGILEIRPVRDKLTTVSIIKASPGSLYFAIVAITQSGCWVRDKDNLCLVNDNKILKSICVVDLPHDRILLKRGPLLLMYEGMGDTAYFYCMISRNYFIYLVLNPVSSEWDVVIDPTSSRMTPLGVIGGKVYKLDGKDRVPLPVTFTPTGRSGYSERNYSFINPDGCYLSSARLHNNRQMITSCPSHQATYALAPDGLSSIPSIRDDHGNILIYAADWVNEIKEVDYTKALQLSQ